MTFHKHISLIRKRPLEVVGGGFHSIPSFHSIHIGGHLNLIVVLQNSKYAEGIL